jgi:hypothetical protein
MCRACSTNRGEEEYIWDIDGETRKNDTARKTRHGWVDNIRVDRGENVRYGVDWIGLAQDRDQ